MNREHRDKLLSYALIRFISLPALLILTAIILLIFTSFRIFSESTALWALVILSITETISWLLWLVWTLKKIDKQERPRLWAINVAIVAIYALFFTLGYNLIFGYELDMTEKSPCGQYTVEVYIPRVRFAMPGGGGIYSNPVRVVLRNRWGWVVGRSDRNYPPSYADLEFDWDYKDKRFWYTKGGYIEF